MPIAHSAICDYSNWLLLDCHLFQDALSVYDVPQMFSWCKDSLCVGFKRDYYVIDVCRHFLHLSVIFLT